MEEETSKAAFYVLGALFAGWAVLLGALGIMRHRTFPPSAGAARGIIVVGVVLMVAVMASSVLTA